MYPVQGGTQKITINKPDNREYDAMKEMYVAQAAKAMSVPEQVKGTRSSQYGTVSVMPNDLVDSNFSQDSSAANAPTAPKTTGKIGNGIATSSTVIPDQDPESVQRDAILNEKNRRRMEMIAAAASNADYSNNNRQQTMRA